MSARRIRIVAFIAILWNFLEGAPTLSVTTPGEYGEMWTLTCNDATYALGGAYNWFKDGSTIFTQAGEKVTTGKYTKEESAGSFKLLIHNLTIADYGIYKCNHNFTESANTNFTVQASAKKDNTVAKRDKDKHLEITLKIVYPAFTFAAVTYKAQQIPGSFKASVANGDRYDMIWRSTSPVDIAEKNPELSIVLTGGYTTQTLANIAIDLVFIFIFGIALWLGLCIAGVVLLPVGLFILIILIIKGKISKGKIVLWKFIKWDLLVGLPVTVVTLYSLIVGAIAVSMYDECKECTECDEDDCDIILGLGIVCIVLSFKKIVWLIVLIFKRQGWCGERFTCLNTVLPVCKDTEARGPPDGKSDHPAVKEKHKEVKLLTHKEQTQQHHKETVVNKGKTSGEKHEEPSKGQPRPLPVPTGNNSPMPEIPSDRHKRGLSANFNDDRDKPLDDNIVHTLKVVNKPKTALDPLNAEDQSKNADDQPKKKKKKKKKERDTSRSEEMEDGN